MERVAFVMHVKEGEEEEYRRRHREVWPAVLAELERAGVRSMCLYMEVEKYAEAVRSWRKVVGALGAPISRTGGDAYVRTTPIRKGCRRFSIGGWPVVGRGAILSPRKSRHDNQSNS